MWSNKRTAGTQLGWAGLPAVLFLLTLLVGHAQAADQDDGDAPGLRAAFGISGALAIDFFAAKSNAYIVEGQIADGSWERVYGPVYGNGEQVQEFISEVDRFQAFRLDVQSLAELGAAPMVLSGHAYAFNYGSELTSLQFDSESEGIVEGVDGIDQVFSYAYEKTQPDTGHLMLNFGGTAGVESVVMEFERGRIGVFTSTLVRAGRRDFKSSGTFRAGADLSLPETPLPLVGSRFVFRDRGMTTVLTFSTDFSGSLSRQGGGTEVISYTYDVSSWPEASLNVELTSAVETHAYDLHFNGRNSGVFVRRSIVNGHTTDTDRGKFSGKGSSGPDGGKSDSKKKCLAPESLAGRTLQVHIGNKVETILLNGAGTGSILKRMPNGRVILEPFTYSYTQESCTEGLLTIVSPTGSGDEVQVFELDFSNDSGGTCVRKRYENGHLDDTHDGDFTLSEDDDDLVRENEGGDDEM